MQKDKSLTRSYKSIIVLVVLALNNLQAQTELFNSKVGFSRKHLEEFYSSFTLENEQIFFIGNDYTLHAYNTKDGKELWSQYLGNKTNTPPQFYGDQLFVNKYLYGETINRKCSILNAKTGEPLHDLNFASLNTKPYFKDNLMYCTGNNDGGQIIAYDLKQNKIVWGKFIGHGAEKKPYYLKDKIIVNADSDSWVTINYQGQVVEQNCKKNETTYLDTLVVCAKRFNYLNHKQKEIVIDKIDRELDEYASEISYLKDFTVLFSNNKIVFLNERNKIKKSISTDVIFEEIENESDGYALNKILHLNENTITFLTNNIVVEYDHVQNKTLKTFNINKWNPHQAVLDKDILWVISKNDGELYGLNLKDNIKLQ